MENSKLSTYWIAPKAPLMFRDGRPFGGAERAETLRFPIPSTLAGAFRTLYGDAEGLDFARQKEQVLKLRLLGPLLARRHLSDDSTEVMFPKPADVVYFGEKSNLRAVRLAPAVPFDGEGSDLDDLSAQLEPVFLNEDHDEKPSTGPAFWNLSTYMDWLKDDSNSTLSMKGIGAFELPTEIRTHVAMDRQTLTNRDGQLFQTSGLDFGPPRLDAHHGEGPDDDSESPREATDPKCWEDFEYGLLVRTAIDRENQLPDGFRTIGGERRPARIEKLDRKNDPWPVCPNLSKGIKGLRLILVTPALFSRGWCPGWLNDNLEGSPPGCETLKLRLRAAALDRWQAVSGWDMQPENTHRHHKGGVERAVRRMAPAGSVYWFEIIENGARDSQNPLQCLWLTSVCDLEQDNRDGFGLAAVGVWTPPA